MNRAWFEGCPINNTESGGGVVVVVVIPRQKSHRVCPLPLE